MFLVYLFPTNIREFRRKMVNFLKIEGNKGGRQANFKQNLENRQSENFCLTYFSKLNRNCIEKKLCHFKDNTVSKRWEGGGCKLHRKFPQSDTTFGFDVPIFVDITVNIPNLFSSIKNPPRTGIFFVRY